MHFGRTCGHRQQEAACVSDKRSRACASYSVADWRAAMQKDISMCMSRTPLHLMRSPYWTAHGHYTHIWYLTGHNFVAIVYRTHFGTLLSGRNMGVNVIMWYTVTSACTLFSMIICIVALPQPGLQAAAS